jgi:hypothetical protein
MMELEPINNHGRKCLCCGYIRKPDDAAPTGICPHCKSSYGKHYRYDDVANARRFATRSQSIHYTRQPGTGGYLIKSLIVASVLVISLVAAKLSGIHFGSRGDDNSVTSVTHTVKVVSKSN